MKRSRGWRAWLGAVACAAAVMAPAAARTVDFEDLLPTVFAGESITSGGFRFTSDGFGFSGVDSSAFFALGVAPIRSSGQFLFMLATDGMYMDDLTGASFDLRGFDVAYIAAEPGLAPGLSVGELYVQGLLADGSGIVQDIFALPAADANGDFPFARMRTSNLAGQAVSLVAFFGCTYTDEGCDFAATNIPPQFALDNITTVPEPATTALALAAIALMAASRRRHGA